MFGVLLFRRAKEQGAVMSQRGGSSLALIMR